MAARAIRHVLAAGVSLVAAAASAHASGDRALGEYLSNECTACHQLSGKHDGRIPAIVGWPQDQFVAVMQSYRDKHRDNVVMQTVAGRLSDDEFAALATYFGSLKPNH
jgi:cytochrome c553